MLGNEGADLDGNVVVYGPDLRYDATDAHGHLRIAVPPAPTLQHANAASPWPCALPAWPHAKILRVLHWGHKGGATRRAVGLAGRGGGSERQIMAAHSPKGFGAAEKAASQFVTGRGIRPAAGRA
jgi:hypothetical protein